MNQLLTCISLGFICLIAACKANNNTLVASKKTMPPDCPCDTSSEKKVIANRNFNRIIEYDTILFRQDSFYSVDSSVIRMLWYRDVENTDTTKFTSLFDAYSPTSYFASHADFIKYYSGRKNIEMAFQFGPNGDLWAYHIFIIKKIKCCYLVTRSYFRHARFTYKAWALINGKKLDSLYSILDKIRISPAAEKEMYAYRGGFVDNRHEKTFFIDFEKEREPLDSNSTGSKPKIEIRDLYDFVDEHIGWIKTYSL